MSQVISLCLEVNLAIIYVARWLKQNCLLNNTGEVTCRLCKTNVLHDSVHFAVFMYVAMIQI